MNFFEKLFSSHAEEASTSGGAIRPLDQKGEVVELSAEQIAKKTANNLIRALEQKSEDNSDFKNWFIKEYKNRKNQPFLLEVASKADHGDWRYAIEAIFDERRALIESLGGVEKEAAYSKLAKEFADTMEFLAVD